MTKVRPLAAHPGGSAGIGLRSACGIPTSRCRQVTPVATFFLTPARFFVLVALALVTLQGCDDPCAALEQKVCNDPVYLKANKKHCDLISETDRRENLPKEACKGILDSLSKR